MNERMNQLQTEAARYAKEKYPSDIVKWSLCMSEKFAELIVKECALLCVSRPGPGDDVRSREHCSEQILQHFGVER